MELSVPNLKTEKNLFHYEEEKFYTRHYVCQAAAHYLLLKFRNIRKCSMKMKNTRAADETTFRTKKLVAKNKQSIPRLRKISKVKKYFLRIFPSLVRARRLNETRHMKTTTTTATRSHVTVTVWKSLKCCLLYSSSTIIKTYFTRPSN